MSSFIHLNNRTQYSLLQGAIRIKELVSRTVAHGSTAVAITDNHNLFGAIDFYLAAKEAKLKPIIGVNLFFTPHSRASHYDELRNKAGQLASGHFKLPSYHLTVLTKSYKGYQNLSQILTQSYLNLPRDHKGIAIDAPPIADPALLSKYGEDLIILSGGLKGHIAYQLLNDQADEAEKSALWFKEKWGEDFYLEIQDHGLPEELSATQELEALSLKLGVPLVATNSCHYVSPADSDSHEILQCIEFGKTLDFDRPKSLVPPEYYLKTPEEMQARFERFPEAVANTLKIAEKCNTQFKFKDEQGKAIYHLPDFRPEGVSKEDNFDLTAYFREQAVKGLKERFESPAFERKVTQPDWAEKVKVYDARLEEEATMIEKTGFLGYFLIVSDFINWAKSQGIPVGPGRGSGAGSLIAYVLKITDIDPIEFNLLFERFINPERVSMPDFDIDFCQDRRGEVIKYVEEKYGKENVSQIITFGKLQARAAVKDVGRVLGLTFAETDQINKLIPDELNIKLADALEKSPELRDKLATDRRLATVYDYALKLEGLYRNAGMHAAGVIITEHPIVTYCPLYASREGDLVTQFDKDFSEKIGLIKFDFLGLKTLTVIDLAVKLIHLNADEDSLHKNFSIEKILYDDTKVFDLVCSGDTDGIFQVESSGMKDLCLRLRPNSVEDLTAISALFRPGPLGSGMVDDFVDRKHGRKPNVYDVPALEPILRETYGVILYQEQVMQIARELAGYTLGQADMLRRAMGKKKADEMAKNRDFFIEGALKKGLAVEKSGAIFDLMAKFAEYGFNKSHSAAYAMITYQTAYLKTHFPVEFMAALMTTEMGNTEKITKYIADARSHQVAILPASVNESERKFSVSRLPSSNLKAVRFGLEAIKGVGSSAVDEIIVAREAAGPFKNVLDFVKRVSTRKVNKKVMESLIQAGAFDEIAETNRASLFASVDSLLEVGSIEQEERAMGQTSLFDSFKSDAIKATSPNSVIFKSAEDWSFSRKLSNEKQVLGFYVSGHPMDAWHSICEQWLGWTTDKLVNWAAAQSKSMKPAQPGANGGNYQKPQRKEAKIAGIFAEAKEIQTKKGKMAFIQLEDLRGRVELVFFSDSYIQNGEKIRQAQAEAEPVVIEGDLDVRDEMPKILVRKVDFLKDVIHTRSHEVTIRLKVGQTTADQLRALRSGLISHRGKCGVKIELIADAAKVCLDLGKKTRVSGTPEMVSEFNKIFGSMVVELR